MCQGEKLSPMKSAWDRCFALPRANGSFQSRYIKVSQPQTPADPKNARFESSQVSSACPRLSTFEPSRSHHTITMNYAPSHQRHHSKK